MLEALVVVLSVLFFLGMFALPIGIVWMIVNAIRKKSPRLGGIIAGTGLILFIGAGTGVYFLDSGSPTPTITEIQIDTLSTTRAAPASLLTVSGAGFDPLMPSWSVSLMKKATQ
ncbi:hypothetical protein ACFLXO_05660 [Chloroflexota bacterium]